jgi:hypothetical protein
LIRAIVFDASGTLLNDIYAVWKANSDTYLLSEYMALELLK